MTGPNIWLRSSLFVVFFSSFSGCDSADPPIEPAPMDPVLARNIALAGTAFRTYNPNVSDSTVMRFCRIAHAYGFSEEALFRKCVGQICLESKAKQSAISSGKARGMGQIVPTTAFEVLHKMSPEDFEKMRALGATSIAWARTGRYSRNVVDGSLFIGENLRAKAIAWLNDETNNLLLWAHIMRKNSAKRGFDHALLVYRLGSGNAALYRGAARGHPYVRKIDRIGASINEERRP